MKPISRRTLLTTGIAAAASASGLAVADRMARRYGLIPPDCHGIYGPGETLTYAAQRVLTTHSLAREFPRSMISKTAFANTEVSDVVITSVYKMGNCSRLRIEAL